MGDYDNYLKGLLQQILDSYAILSNLKDKPGDLDVIQKELSKINGLLRVIVLRLDTLDDTSDSYVTLQSLSKSYLDNFDFFREIDIMSNLYSDDPNRLKNMRSTILKSFQDQKFITKLENICNNLS